MIFYCYNKCSTCRKAKKVLIDKKIDFEEIDITLNPPTFEMLKILVKEYSLEINKLFNTSGLIYRQGNYKEKIKIMSDKEKLLELSKNGKLIKRPILILENNVLIGYNEEEYKKL